jgi:hypothetical protein
MAQYFGLQLGDEGGCRSDCLFLSIELEAEDVVIVKGGLFGPRVLKGGDGCAVVA